VNNLSIEVTTISPESLAKRWNIDATTVYKYVNSGILRRVDKIGAVRVLLSDVEELESSGDKSKSFKERKLERRLEEKEREIEVLKGVIAKFQLVNAEAVYLMTNQEV
jgi:hypothetical protein